MLNPDRIYRFFYFFFLVVPASVWLVSYRVFSLCNVDVFVYDWVGGAGEGKYSVHHEGVGAYIPCGFVTTTRWDTVHIE